MPSFDAVSEVDKHELTNAVDQASRDLGNRYDLRGTDARFELEDNVITQYAPTEHQLDQLLEMLKIRLAGRHIDLRAVEVGEVLTNLAGSRREITIKQGLEQAQAKKINAEADANVLRTVGEAEAAKTEAVGAAEAGARNERADAASGRWRSCRVVSSERAGEEDIRSSSIRLTSRGAPPLAFPLIVARSFDACHAFLALKVHPMWAFAP